MFMYACEANLRGPTTSSKWTCLPGKFLGLTLGDCSQHPPKGRVKFMIYIIELHDFSCKHCIVYNGIRDLELV